MSATRVPVDLGVRRDAASDLTTTYLVEAGAGTGKTRLLVARYVAALIDGAPVTEIAAITFTEKAAGELRQKVRERLELLLEGDPEALRDTLGEAGVRASLDPETQARLAAALADLDGAVISTIHAFAARLLRERPVEARIDPGFRQLDEIGADLSFAEAWAAWLAACADDAAVSAPGRASLAEALGAGVALSEVRRLSIAALGRRYHVQPTIQPAPPDLAAAVAGLRSRAKRLTELSTTCADPDDGLCRGLAALAEAAARLPDDGECHESGRALLGLVAGSYGSANAGRKGNWPGGKDEVTAARDEALAVAAAAAGEYGDYLAATALAAAWGFVAFAAGRNESAGALDFDDLLGRARDLLVGDRLDRDTRSAVRTYFQRRYRYLLVDEFQDTDPLQVELVMFLAEREPRADDWREVELEPGKLFLVGDPKQSIYRFRKADIAIYQSVKQVIDRQGKVVSIAQSFRAVPALIAWFNRTFADLIGGVESELQPKYGAVDQWRPATGDGPCVTVLRVEAPVDERADAVRRAEADAVGALLASLQASGWLVADAATPDGVRAARPGDVAVLFRTLTSLETYERAFREAGVGFRVDGGKSFFKRAEVMDTLAALRALDVPGDALAVYAALHGCLFGFADDELLVYHLAGGRFDLFAGRPEGHAGIAAALDLMRELHQSLHSRSVAATVAELVERTGLLELLAGETGAAQARGNVQQLLDLAAAHAGRPEASFHDYVAQLAELQARDEGESAAGEDDDAVRLMTVHKAKGLEFPIVVLADPCGEPLTVGKADALVARGAGTSTRGVGRLVAGVRVDPPGGELAKPVVCRSLGHETVRAYEHDAEACEGRRLLYVAATRATERLVVPLRLDESGRPAQAKAASFAGLLGPHLDPGARAEEAPGLVDVVGPPPRPDRTVAAAAAPSAEALMQMRAAVLGARQDALRRGTRPAAVVAPSALELVDDGLEERVAPFGRAVALGLGGVVHAVLQRAPLDDEAAVRVMATQLARGAGLGDKHVTAADLAISCWRARPVREAATASRTWRELPMAARIDGVLVEGAADLVYERDGGLVLVDFKTDRGVDEATVRERYELQLAAYAIVLEQAARRPVVEALLVLASRSGAAPASVIPVALDDELRRRVRDSLAKEYTGHPVAV